MSSCVTLEIENGVGRLVLNRPAALNAMNSAMVDDLGDAVQEASNSAAIRAVLITGAGRAFCAGADVKEWGAGDSSWTPRIHHIMATLYWLTKPVVAAINGAAVGAGCDLALVADLRVAGRAARIGQAYVHVGYCPDVGGSFLLPRLVGEARATEMIFTGRLVGADEALTTGLVNEVVEDDRLQARAFELTSELAAGPTVALGLAKRNIRKSYERTFEQALAAEQQAGELCARTVDHSEGLRAITERRRPHFVGR